MRNVKRVQTSKTSEFVVIQLPSIFMFALTHITRSAQILCFPAVHSGNYYANKQWRNQRGPMTRFHVENSSVAISIAKRLPTKPWHKRLDNTVRLSWNALEILDSQLKSCSPAASSCCCYSLQLSIAVEGDDAPPVTNRSSLSHVTYIITLAFNVTPMNLLPLISQSLLSL